MAATYSQVLNQSGYIPPHRDKRKVREIRRPHCLHIKFSKEAQFANGIRNEAKDIVLKCLGKSQVKAIAVRPYNSIDVTCVSRTAVLTMAKFMESQTFSFIVKWYLYEPELVKCHISWVPGHLTTANVKKSLLEYIAFDSEVVQSIDKDGISEGIMVAKIPPKNLEECPIPSYIYCDGYILAVKYYGQKKTCKQCGSLDHFKIDCPIKMVNKDKQNQKKILSATEAQEKTTESNLKPQFSSYIGSEAFSFVNTQDVPQSFEHFPPLNNASSVKSTQDSTKDGTAVTATPVTEDVNTLKSIDDTHNSQIFELASVLGQQKRLHSDSPNNQPRSQRKCDTEYDDITDTGMLEEDRKLLMCAKCGSNIVFVDEETEVMCECCSSLNVILKQCCQKEGYFAATIDKIQFGVPTSCNLCQKTVFYSPCCHDICECENNVIKCKLCSFCYIKCYCSALNKPPRKGTFKECTNDQCKKIITYCCCGIISVSEKGPSCACDKYNESEYKPSSND